MPATTFGPLDKVRSLLADASNMLDEDAPEKESRASFLKRIDISTAIDKAINLCDSYQEWAERELEEGR